MAGGTRSFEMGRGLLAAGHEIVVITSCVANADGASETWRVSNESGMEVHWASVPYNNGMGFYRRIHAFLKFSLLAAIRVAAIKGDVIFSTSTPLTIAIPAIYGARRQSTPMVFEVRDLWPTVPIELGVLKSPMLKWLARKLERWAYRNSERIVALAPGMKDAVVATGCPAGKVSVSPNGADLDVFCIDDAQGRELRRRTAWLGSRPEVLYYGSMGAINGVDFLLRLARLLLPFPLRCAP